MRKLLALFLFCVATFAFADIVTLPIPGAPGLSVTVGTGVNALPLTDIRSNPNAVNITTWDDNYTNVPLGFDFPMYGRTFNNSWAMTNGMVTFQDPAVSGIYGACCSGVNLTQTTDTRWNYSIFGVHTDLYSWNGQNQFYLREANAMTYGWYNISQCCGSQGGNSFEIKINSAGVIDTRIAGAMVQWNAVTSGFSGDLSKGEYFQYYHGQGWNIPNGAGVSWGAFNGTGGGAVDLCIANPLSSPSCPNYFTAQCTISALYNPSCPGYAAAYLTQQCTANPLYSTECPGYANAYLEYQCSVNPLYSTTCQGYEQAYFDQQCSISGLYSTRCPNYQQAYFEDQCRKNGLYSTQCPNYSTAYATWLALNAVNTTPTTSTTSSSTTSTTTTTTSAPTVESSGEIKVAVVADSNVNTVIQTTATSASPAQAATATVPLVAAPAPVAAPTVEAKVEAKQETKTEEKKSDSNSTPTQTTTAASASDSKPAEGAKPTARQEIQAKREAAAKAKAVEDGKNLANNMGKAADMEQQKAVQNVVIQAMGFTPGFDAYQVTMPDVKGYKPYAIYTNQKTVDNRRLGLGLFGPSDKVHSDMVDSQYNRNN